MFCGECGSSTSATPESRRRPDPRPGDTTAIERPARRNSGVISIPVHGFHASDDDDDERADAGIARVLDDAASSAVEGGDVLRADAAIARVLDAAASSALTGPPSAPAAAPAATPAAPTTVASARTSPRFVLSFSTGETRTVFGTGLIGRRPLPQPGEEFDHLVQIADRTLSVSKTHLEFGEHEGQLWIADRFSGNGTVVRRPDDGALRCEPGRRYLVPRGSLVELAEQSFTVA
jgi:hypothetical protein